MLRRLRFYFNQDCFFEIQTYVANKVKLAKKESIIRLGEN